MFLLLVKGMGLVMMPAPGSIPAPTSLMLLLEALQQLMTAHIRHSM
jgi:hypothetical protein